MSTATLERYILVRAATDAELPACRILLPEAFAWGAAPSCVLAVSRDPLRFLGASAFVTGRGRFDGRPLLRIAARVAKPHRGRGIGRQLLDGLKDAARRRGITRLSASADLGRHRKWADFLSCQGFQSVERVHFYEIDVDRLASFFLPRREWLINRGTLPDDASIVPLREIPTEQVARLFAEHLGGLDDHHDTGLKMMADCRTSNFGFALTIRGEIRAALLQKAEGDRTSVEAIVVAPSCRGEGIQMDWAHILLSAAECEWSLQHGVRKIRFAISASNPRAMKLYLRFGPEEIEVRERYELAMIAESPELN